MKYVAVFCSVCALTWAGELMFLGPPTTSAWQEWRTDSAAFDARTFETECLKPFVTVEVPNAMGSGVVIESNEYGSSVLTAAHVVRQRRERVNRTPAQRQNFGNPYPSSSIKVVRTEKGVRHEYKVYGVVKYDAVLDLAVLWLETPNLPAVHGLADTVHVGERCWYVGNPGGLRELAEGSIISAVDWSDDENGRHTITGGFGWHGNSGGPMFVKRGGHYDLAGICQFGWLDLPKSPVVFARPQDIKFILGGL